MTVNKGMHTLKFTHKTSIFKATFYSAIIYNFKRKKDWYFTKPSKI